MLQNLGPKKLVLSGESAGGYLATVVAMLAEGKDIDLLIPIMPMTTNDFVTKPVDAFDEFS